MRYRFKTAARDNTNIGSNLEIKNSLEAPASTEDSDTILGNRPYFLSDDSRLSNSKIRDLDQDNELLTGQPLEELAGGEASSPRHIALRSQEPWKQYLLNYCKSNIGGLRIGC